MECAIASSVNHTVGLPRQRREASYSAQFVTLRYGRGMCWRRAAFALYGIAGNPADENGAPTYLTRSIRAKTCHHAQDHWKAEVQVHRI